VVLTKERIRQHLQTGEVHSQQNTKKNKYEQTKLLPNTESNYPDPAYVSAYGGTNEVQSSLLS